MGRKGFPGNSTVTLTHSRTKNIEEYTKYADIIITALGKPEFLKADMVKEGVTIIDVGITRVPDASRPRGYRITGDVDFENVENFVEKVSTLKESYFGIEKLEAVSDDSAVVSEDADFSGAGDVAQPVNEGMSQYTAALTKFAKINTTQK